MIETEEIFEEEYNIVLSPEEIDEIKSKYQKYVKVMTETK